MILPILEGEAYQDLAKVFSELPSSTALKKLVKELNRKWNITPTPNGTFGVQQSLRERLLLRMEHLHRTAPEDAPFR